MHGLLDARALAGLIVGLGVTGAFLRRQWRADHPLLDVRKLAGITVGMGLVGCIALFFAAYSTAFVTVQYLSRVHGLSALQIGLTLLTYAVLLVPLTFVSARAARRVGVGPLIIGGLLVLGGMDLVFATLSVGDPLWHYIAMAIIWGGGCGLMQAPATEAIVAALPDEEQGLASAVNDITRELGAALGIAVSGAVLIANLEPASTPAAAFMTAWPETCVALALANFLCAASVAVLHHWAPHRVGRPGGRHAAARRVAA